MYIEIYNPASVSMLTRVGKETYLFLNKLEISVNKGIVLVNGEPTMNLFSLFGLQPKKHQHPNFASAC